MNDHLIDDTRDNEHESGCLPFDPDEPTDRDTLAYEAADEQALEAELQARCGFTKEQCDWVMSMPARRLTTAYRTQLDREIDELTEHLTSEP